MPVDPRIADYLGILDEQKKKQAQQQDLLSQINARPQTDYNQYAALAKAASQLGTIGGKSADTSAVDQSAQDITNQQSQSSKNLMNQAQMGQDAVDKNTGLKLKTLEYLQSAQDRANSQKDKMNELALRRQELGIKNKSADYEKNEKLATALKQDLDPNAARGGNFAMNQKRVDQADRLMGLIKDSSGNISNLDSRQTEELAIGLNSMLSGSGQGSANQVAALVPSTVRGDANKLKEWLTNEPTGSDQQAFVQRMADTVQRERDIAANQVKNVQLARLAAHSGLQQKAPDLYANVIHGYGIDDNDLTNFQKQQMVAMQKRNQAPGLAHEGDDGSAMAAGMAQPPIDDGTVLIQAPPTKMYPQGRQVRVKKEQADAAVQAGGKIVGH